MSFRMKRNGAGLASICVLACMALFTIILTSGLYFGSAQILRKMYPMDLARVEGDDDGKTAEFIQNKLVEIAKEKGVQPKDIVKYRFLKQYDTYGVYQDKKLVTDKDLNSMTIDKANALYNALGQTCFYYIPTSDYNSVMGTNLSVNRGEALVLRLKSEPKDENYDLIPVMSELIIEETKAEIRSSINSQVLTLFFTPPSRCRNSHRVRADCKAADAVRADGRGISRAGCGHLLLALRRGLHSCLRPHFKEQLSHCKLIFA